MTILFTAFLWGLGVSLGSAFGLIAFFLMFWGLEAWTGRAKQKKTYYEQQQESLNLLDRRNELSEDANATQSEIADTLSQIAQHYDDAKKLNADSRN